MRFQHRAKKKAHAHKGCVYRLTFSVLTTDILWLTSIPIWYELPPPYTAGISSVCMIPQTSWNFKHFPFHHGPAFPMSSFPLSSFTPPSSSTGITAPDATSSTNKGTISGSNWVPAPFSSSLMANSTDMLDL